MACAPSIPRVEILVASVEIDQDDAPLDLFAVEGLELAPPSVVQGTPDPVGKGIQSDQVGQNWYMGISVSAVS